MSRTEDEAITIAIRTKAHTENSVKQMRPTLEYQWSEIKRRYPIWHGRLQHAYHPDKCCLQDLQYNDENKQAIQAMKQVRLEFDA